MAIMFGVWLAMAVVVFVTLRYFVPFRWLLVSGVTLFVPFTRLAVAPDYRRVGRLGAELIRLAVSTANGQGCAQFNAHVQAQNEALFRRLHWEAVGTVDLHGVPHVHMQASLPHYPAIPDPAIGWSARSRR